MSKYDDLAARVDALSESIVYKDRVVHSRLDMQRIDIDALTKRVGELEFSADTKQTDAEQNLALAEQELDEYRAIRDRLVARAEEAEKATVAAWRKSNAEAARADAAEAKLANLRQWAIQRVTDHRGSDEFDRGWYSAQNFAARHVLDTVDSKMEPAPSSDSVVVEPGVLLVNGREVAVDEPAPSSEPVRWWLLPMSEEVSHRLLDDGSLEVRRNDGQWVASHGMAVWTLEEVSQECTEDGRRLWRAGSSEPEDAAKVEDSNGSHWWHSVRDSWAYWGGSDEVPWSELFETADGYVVEVTE